MSSDDGIESSNCTSIDIFCFKLQINQTSRLEMDAIMICIVNVCINSNVHYMFQLRIYIYQLVLEILSFYLLAP